MNESYSLTIVSKTWDVERSKYKFLTCMSTKRTKILESFSSAVRMMLGIPHPISEGLDLGPSIASGSNFLLMCTLGGSKC